MNNILIVISQKEDLYALKKAFELTIQKSIILKIHTKV